MEIEKIIYETTREIYNLEDKLRIATIFLFCEKLGSSKLSELLYTENHGIFISEISKEYENYAVDFSINFSNSNVKSAFLQTLEKVKKECDGNGYLKALFNKDEYALVIEEIVNYNFDEIEFKKFTTNLVEQLSFDFENEK
jgi:hypothetical protein